MILMIRMDMFVYSRGKPGLRLKLVRNVSQRPHQVIWLPPFYLLNIQYVSVRIRKTDHLIRINCDYVNSIIALSQNRSVPWPDYGQIHQVVRLLLTTLDQYYYRLVPWLKEIYLGSKKVNYVRSLPRRLLGIAASCPRTNCSLCVTYHAAWSICVQLCSSKCNVFLCHCTCHYN